MQLPQCSATLRFPLLFKAAYQALLLLKYSPCNFIPLFQRRLMKNIDAIAPERRHKESVTQIYGNMPRAKFAHVEPFSL